MEIQEAAPLSPTRKLHPALSAFRHRNFRIFFTGQTVSLIGTWSQSLALSWLVWRITHSPAWLGVIGFTVQFPMLLFGLAGGWAADRFDRRYSLILMQTLCMLQAIVLAALTLSNMVTLWQIFSLSVMLGIVYAFEFPLRQTFVMDMVGKRDLLNAVSLNAGMIHSTRIAGPVAAGAIVAWKGEGICFLFNALTFLSLIAALAMIDPKSLIPAQREPSNMFSSIREGLGFMNRQPKAKMGLILTAAVSIIGMSYIPLMPIYADLIFDRGSVGLGWLMGSSGAGALLGALWLAGRSSSEKLLTLSCAAATLFSVALMVFSQMPSIWLGMPLLSAVGFFATIHYSTINTLLQHNVPDKLRGRAMSIFTTIAMGLAPFGILTSGLTAKFLGAPTTALLLGTGCLIASTAIWIKARAIDEGL
ncbi:MAG TPA: MFS transporter [bacterium]|nr:MFS transporter [bacterium]